jgi:hypothetical protein
MHGLPSHTISAWLVLTYRSWWVRLITTMNLCGFIVQCARTGSCFAGMSDHWSVLAAQRPREPEAGEDAGVEKLRDRGDLFAFEG